MLYSFLKKKNLLEQFCKECIKDQKGCNTIIGFLMSEDTEGLSRAFSWTGSLYGFHFWDDICEEYSKCCTTEKVDIKEIRRCVENMFNKTEEEFEYE